MVIRRDLLRKSRASEPQCRVGTCVPIRAGGDAGSRTTGLAAKQRDSLPKARNPIHALKKHGLTS